MPNELCGIIRQIWSRIIDFQEDLLKPHFPRQLEEVMSVFEVQLRAELGRFVTAEFRDADLRNCVRAMRNINERTEISSIKRERQNGHLPSRLLDLLQRAADKRRRLISCYEQMVGIPCVATFGTARNCAVQQWHDEFYEELARILVSQGVWLINGGSETGLMGMPTTKWLRAIRQNSKTTAGVAVVPLDIQGDNPNAERAFDIGTNGLRFPKFEALEPRTLLMLLIAQRGRIFADGGLGTLQEFSITALSSQMRGTVTTIASHNEAIPPSILLSADDYWSGLATFFADAQKALTINTTDPENTHFVRGSDPKKAAAEVAGLCGAAA